MLDNKSSLQSGFTLVEMVVVVSLTALVGVTFLGLSANYFVVINRTNQLSEMTIDSQNLLRSTVENIRYGDGVRQTSQISDPHAPAGGWNTSNTAFVIIIAVPALDASRNYIVDSDTGSPYMNELVYYKNGSTLMQRRLAHPDAIGNRLHTTCPPAQETANCAADKVLAEYVHTMNFALYDQDGIPTSTPAQARSVKINLNMRRGADSNPINLTTAMQVTLRNRF